VREDACRDPRGLRLVRGLERLAAPEQRVAAEGDDRSRNPAHRYSGTSPGSAIFLRCRW
jgi:hypothetical protein